MCDVDDLGGASSRVHSMLENSFSLKMLKF